ncbi:U6 snRNP complex subunit PRP24 [Sporobolomyces koalae]|uniref:U6 snRNP complex subunit PRP24 n=1 Tax=Sporobolomyces koalae TaxID=500713 RepID=UPI0031707B58
MADEANPDELLQRYSATLEQLAQSPFKRETYVERIELATRLGLEDEIEAGRNDYADHLVLSEAEWSEWIQSKQALLPSSPVEDVEPYMNLIALYQRANRDYLSIPLLRSFSNWTIDCYYTAQGISRPLPALEQDDDEQMQPSDRKTGQPDPLLQVVFSLETVRDICTEVLNMGGKHLAESSTLWTIWRDFETDLLILEKTPDQLIVVEELYTNRLAIPHLNIKQTFDEYSSFVTKFDNDNYDQSLPAASKIYSVSSEISNERESEEAKLKSANFSAQAYLDYIEWERQPKRPDTRLVKALFERAIKDHSSELEIWETWIEFEWRLVEKDLELQQVGEKSIRFNPGNALLWANYMRIAEKMGQISDVEGVFARAIATRLFEQDMDAVVTLYHARAAAHARLIDLGPDGPDIELVGTALGILQEGIAKTKQVHKKGDKQHRLEKFMIRIYERFQMFDEAGQVWQDLTKAEPWSYAAWYGRADFETRAGRYDKAHKVYVGACSARGVDYPEYLLEVWLNFERECGTAEDLQYAIVKVKRSRKNLERRRAREAEQAAAAAAAAGYAAQTSAVPSASTGDADSFIASAVETASSSDDPNKKRERSPAAEGADGATQTVKKARFEPPVPSSSGPAEPKRDREHSTVFAISSGSMSEEDVHNLFKDCGAIRESKVKEIDGRTYAMLEFMEKKSVLAAQTKDKKRIHEAEVEVYIAWQSCLYVTNFPESFDKPAVEKLFEKYGVIFDTRWPSKRFKNTRRFCYVQFAVPSHAQAALELNGTELEPGHKLGVFVSDPARKKSRTDSGANNRELYVSSLAKFVKEDELRKVFEPYGALKGIRIVTDDKGDCKGFAFVEYEDEASAQAALALNNHELRKRRMAVTIAQSRAHGTAKNNAPTGGKLENENRSIRVRGLAPGTEEAIIQQTFEKFATVEKVVFEVGSTEAVVMFENAADVGKVLMQRDSITVDDTPVEVFADGRQVRTAQGKKPVTTTTTDKTKNISSSSTDVPLMPRQASRGRGRVGLAGGRGRGGRGAAAFVSAPRGGTTASGSTTSTTTTTTTTGSNDATASDSRGQDDFRAMLLKK